MDSRPDIINIKDVEEKGEENLIEHICLGQGLRSWLQNMISPTTGF